MYRAVFGLPLLASSPGSSIAATAGCRRGRSGSRSSPAIFFAGDLLFWHHAIEYVGAGLATVLGNLQVIVVGVVAWFAFGERPPRSRVPRPAVRPARRRPDLGRVRRRGATARTRRSAWSSGCCTAFCYAGYLLVIRRGGRDLRRPAGPVDDRDASRPRSSRRRSGRSAATWTRRRALASLAWLALLGLTSQSLGYLLISLSLSRLPAVLTSMILLAQPVMTVGLAWSCSHEAPSPAQLLGVALVIGGIAAATLGTEREPDQEPAAGRSRSVNVVPTPSSLATSIVPPQAVTAP